MSLPTTVKKDEITDDMKYRKIKGHNWWKENSENDYPGN